MALGPSTYDDELTMAREMCGANTAILIIIDGRAGSGFACQGSTSVLIEMPAILRQVANDIETDLQMVKNAVNPPSD